MVWQYVFEKAEKGEKVLHELVWWLFIFSSVCLLTVGHTRVHHTWSHMASLFALDRVCWSFPRRCFPFLRRSFHFNRENHFDGRNHFGGLAHATTILSVRKGNEVVVVGDGQVSMGSTIVKPNARKVRVVDNGKVIIGFAGATADCFALLDKLEKKLEQYPGQLLRAAVELAKDWRTDKMLRHLEAMLIAVDKEVSVTLSGHGDVISELPDGVIAIGSGGVFAQSAARALIRAGKQEMTAREIGIVAMNIAAETCVYTNHNFVVEAFVDGQLVSGIETQPKQGSDTKSPTAQGEAVSQ